jgi:uncharacterized SAM-binding protein YcdF (DUF218 family)
MKLLLRLISLAVLLTPLAFLGWLLIFAASLDRREAPTPPQADAIIVLTGGADRIGDGLSLLEAGKGRRLLISGVNQQVTMEDLKRRWPGHDSAFACCVDLDFRALNTFENARESAVWVKTRGVRSLLLVTASYHMPRASLEFATAMPNVAIIAAPVIPATARLDAWWADATLTRIIALESIKYAAAWARTRVWARAP